MGYSRKDYEGDAPVPYLGYSKQFNSILVLAATYLSTALKIKQFSSICRFNEPDNSRSRTKILR